MKLVGIHSRRSTGRSIALRAGDTYIVADGDGAHRSSAPGGAQLFIVD